MRKLLVGLVLASVIAGCQDKAAEFTTTESGFEYAIVKNGSGERPKDGEFMNLHIAYFDANDNKIFSSMDNGQPVFLPYVDSMMVENGSLEEGFKLVAKGDSAVFNVKAQNLFEHTFGRPLPDTIQAESKFSVQISVLDIFTKEQYDAYIMEAQQKAMAEMRAQSEEQLNIDIEIIDAHIAENNIEAKSTPEGLRYEILKEGTGATPQNGQTVQVHYSGTLLSGEPFDSSVERGNPFEFVLGQGGVIQGWDIGFALFPVGTKAKLYIPSTLAYGPRQRSAVITANAILVFEIEMLDILN